MYRPERVPEHTVDALVRYRDHRLTPGGFLYAVLTNDLVGAALRADHLNFDALAHIVGWCSNELPQEAWGSEEAVKRWLSERSRGRT
jgi:hypothetical protein